MKTGPDHVAVTARDVPRGGLAFGPSPADAPAGVLHTAIGAGHTTTDRRPFTAALIQRSTTPLDVPNHHCRW